jgi:hypothetical protein
MLTGRTHLLAWLLMVTGLLLAYQAGALGL